MGELSIESGEATRKFANGDDPVSPDNTLQSSQGRSRENEFVLPEDIHFPLGSAPALRAAEALSWTSRSNLATEGQRAVYRFVFLFLCHCKMSWRNDIISIGINYYFFAQNASDSR